MRPKIMTCHNLKRSLKYNEQKVEIKQAECLMAANFLKGLDRLTFDDKLGRFQRRMQLNDRVGTSQHITLNFDPLDKISNEQMKKIAAIYMKEIGFERQPYLVYRHNDAGHPHCHIVTTHVRANGDPIELFNIGKIESERARVRIEAEFNLVTKEMKQQLKQEVEEVDKVPRVVYGEKSISRSIARVLEHVTENYNFTSLEELNAVLRLYNVEAYRGKEDSQLYQNRGLLYRILDKHGKYIGVPLKASFFKCKPTLDNLEKKFSLNQQLKQAPDRNLVATIWFELRTGNYGLEKSKRKFINQKIGMVLKFDKDRKCQDVLYVDLRQKRVYKWEEIGKGCGPENVEALIQREKDLQMRHELSHRQRQERGYRLRM